MEAKSVTEVKMLLCITANRLPTDLFHINARIFNQFKLQFIHCKSANIFRHLSGLGKFRKKLRRSFEEALEL